MGSPKGTPESHDDLVHLTLVVDPGWNKDSELSVVTAPFGIPVAEQETSAQSRMSPDACCVCVAQGTCSGTDRSDWSFLGHGALPEDRLCRSSRTLRRECVMETIGGGGGDSEEDRLRRYQRGCCGLVKGGVA